MERCKFGTFKQHHLCPAVNRTLRSNFIVHSSLKCIHPSLGLFEFCRNTEKNIHHKINLTNKTVYKWPYYQKIAAIWHDAELTCKQDSQLVCRNGNNGGLCWGRLCSVCLQFKLNHWFIHLPQLTGAQSVVNAPGHRLQSAHWNSLQGRIDVISQSATLQGTALIISYLCLPLLTRTRRTEWLTSQTRLS